MSGLYAQLKILFEAGVLESPTLDACTKKGWTLHPCDFHSQVREEVARSPLAIGFTYEPNLPAGLLPLMVHGRFPHDFVLVSPELTEYKDAIRAFLFDKIATTETSASPLSRGPLHAYAIRTYLPVHAGSVMSMRSIINSTTRPNRPPPWFWIYASSTAFICAGIRISRSGVVFDKSRSQWRRSGHGLAIILTAAGDCALLLGLLYLVGKQLSTAKFDDISYRLTEQNFDPVLAVCAFALSLVLVLCPLCRWVIDNGPTFVKSLIARMPNQDGTSNKKA